MPREQNSEADRLANEALDAAARSGEKPRSPAPAELAPESLKPLRTTAAFRQGILEPSKPLPLVEGEVVDLAIFRRK